MLYRPHGAHIVGAPKAEHWLRHWTGRLGEPMRRLDSYRRQPELARNTLLAFGNRFGDTATLAVRTMLDGHAVGRLQQGRFARTGEIGMKAAVVAAMI